jgi:hypothetical protein
MAATLVLPTIALPPEEAKRKLLEYRAALRDLPASARQKADQLLAQAFYHAAQGKAIISLTAAMHLGGLEPFEYTTTAWGPAPDYRRLELKRQGQRPRLAIGPALAPTCYMIVGRLNGGWHAVYRERPEDGGNQGQTRTVSKDGKHIQVAWSETLLPSDPSRYCEARAKTPYIPPALRRRSLSGLHVLWEAEWTTFGITPEPRDPALLKHIGGDLFVVLDAWDLTDLEMAVLQHAGR